jgi:hypothetical protein
VCAREHEIWKEANIIKFGTESFTDVTAKQWNHCTTESFKYTGVSWENRNSYWWKCMCFALERNGNMSLLVFSIISIPLMPYSYRVEVFHLDLLQSVGLLGRVISPSHGRYLNTGQHKHRIKARANTHTHTKHPCPKWDSSPRSQRPSEQRQFMP